MEVDNQTLVKYRGRHRDIAFEVSAHNFKPDHDRINEFPCMWATYILLTPEQFADWKDKLPSAPWNGGITYERRITEEHYTAPDDIRAKWDKPFYRIGDDFTHLWDIENGMYQCYDRAYMERHIKRVIDWLYDGVADDN